MTAAPLFAPILPPGASPARPTQGEGASDVAGLFALLLPGAQPVQADAAQDAGLSTRPAPAPAPALAGAFVRAPAPPPPAPQPPGPLTPGTSVPAQAGSGQGSPIPQPAPASPDAPLPAAACTQSPARTVPAPAPHPALTDPSPGLTQPPGDTAAPLPAPGAIATRSMMGSFGTLPAASAPAAPELLPMAWAADAKGPPAPSGWALQTSAPRAGTHAPSAEPRAAPSAGAGQGSIAAPGPETRRPHAPLVTPTFGAPGPATDPAAADDHVWLEPSMDGSERTLARFEQAAPEPARAPATGRAAPPAPMFQIGVHIAKAIPARIDRLFVQLEPASLGRVEVRLEFHRDNHVSAVIAAERPDTLDALQRDARVLERSLHQAGLRLDSDGLTFSLKREQAHDHAREERRFASPAGDFGDQPLPAAQGAEPPPLQWFRGLRALDIRV